MTKIKEQEAQSAQFEKPDSLMVLSVEKAFKVLSAFDATKQTLSLTQLAQLVQFDKSAAQRFTHTLIKLGYLKKDPETKRFSLTAKTLDLGYHYTRANPLIDRAMPFLLHLSQETEEAVNLTVLDDTHVVFITRLVSRQVLNIDVVVGTRMPAYCTAPGIAILSYLPPDEVSDIIARSDLQAFTQNTTHEVDALKNKIAQSAVQGYGVAFEEFYLGDLSVAAAIRDNRGRSVAALNIATSRSRMTPKEAEEKFAPLVIAAARSVSQVISA